MNILVLLHDKFNDVEFTGFMACLIRSGKVKGIQYYNPTLKQVTGQFGLTHLKINDKFQYELYDAIFIPGGPAAQDLREDKKSLEIVKKFYLDKKYVYAICDAPNALYENDIFDEDVRYSSYPMPNLVASRNRTEAMVTVGGDHLITGRCAMSGVELGIAAVKQLFGEETAKMVELGMRGNN
ncbi:DJ-1/PfpI family protein [Mycoplasma crocodyli]|uniref:Putative intracellular protease/amidase (Putative glutaminase) n=1 Tax=Mycoplasma crocodyli (strain ATCC 51981 / MP145) TaxID=512564 RepID=D5E4L4_MYCCM|nr:DJ-1/PfpI family protein [Mycoplasma crocodyli]ADE19386.1 putative intracellular protease/amidase (putative glutaminase) [Mycoplasma crocodyli MP145]